MKKHLLIFAAAAASAGGWTAPALGARASVAAVYEAGRCMVERDRHAAVALLESLPLDGPANLSPLRETAAGNCAGAEGASALLVRGAIAQALLFHDFGGFGRRAPDTVAMVNLDLPVESSPAGTRTTELFRWADCVVRNDSAGTQALLASRVGSAEETAALAGLQGYMSVCMGEGQLSVRPSEVRSVFAQSAYHTMYRVMTGQLQVSRSER